MSPPRYLFLQGMCSPMFRRLAHALRAQGAAVHKVHFTTGDMAYWDSRQASLFRGAVAELAPWLSALVARQQLTDVVMFGDGRPVHRAALDVAAAQGLRVHVLEEGYFRPYWFTVERDGVNARSNLPRDPRWYLTTASRLPPSAAPVAFAQPFRNRAVHDVAYHCAGALNPLLFPRYRTHALRAAPLEYAGFLRRAMRLRRERATAQAAVDQWLAHARPFYFLPLQLDQDSQIRLHSRFSGMAEVVGEVLGSFAAHAPAQAGLIIKSHPLDYRWQSLSARVAEECARLGLQGRVLWLEDGDLTPLVAHARGVVTVNSTVGTLALAAGRPVMALGAAIYAIPGLAFTGRLDEFWAHAVPPDAALYAAFESVVMYATQVNGGLYGRAAIGVGLAAAAARLLARRSPLEELMGKPA